MSDPPPAPRIPRSPVGAARRTRALRCLALPGLALAACAGEPAPFEAKDDPGTGTGTLTVFASFVASPRLANTADPDAFDTAFSVVVRRGDVRTPTASVIVSTVAGEAALQFDTRDGGTWLGGQAGYHRVYRLDVVAGDDRIDDFRMVGPDIHTLTAPVADALVDATLPLQVAWTRAAPAELVVVRTRAAEMIPTDDLGTFMIAVGGLTSAPDRAEAEVLTIERLDVLAPGGAANGSGVTVAVRNHVKLTVQPTAPPPMP